MATTGTHGSVASVAARGWRTEDWIAVFVGFLVIAAVLGVFHWKAVDLGKVVSAYRWTTDGQIASLTPGWIEKLGILAKEAESKGQQDIVAPAKDLKEALEKKDRKAIEAAAGKMAKSGGKTLAGALAAEIRGHAAAVAESRIFTWDNASKVVYVGIAYLILAAAGIALLGGRVAPFLLAFPAVFGLAWLARFLAGNGLFVDWGIEYVIFALAVGLLISNTVGVPGWLKPAVQNVTDF